MYFNFCIVSYIIVGVILAVVLLRDKDVNRGWGDAYVCCLVGLFWPLAISLVFSIGLYDNITDKFFVKKQAKNLSLQQFGTQLVKLQLISKETYIKFNAELWSKYL
jgi:hypothetical protein